MNESEAEELRVIYHRRFSSNLGYRQRVWRTLVEQFFQRYVPPKAVVLDLGCGYGEFINTVRATVKYGMDLNPSTASHLSPEVSFQQQDCSQQWPFSADFLDLVFTSNFFEHLPDKATLGRTLEQARRCLKPGGRLIAMGPNIKYLPGQYWDFWDHYIPLTESSLSEALGLHGFDVEECYDRFLPYTMVGRRQLPCLFLVWYLKARWGWRLLGKQFLVIARKPLSGASYTSSRNIENQD